MCFPKKCDLKEFEPKKTPAIECEKNYTFGQEILYDTFHHTKSEKLTDAFIKCV